MDVDTEEGGGEEEVITLVKKCIERQESRSRA